MSATRSLLAVLAGTLILTLLASCQKSHIQETTIIDSSTAAVPDKPQPKPVAVKPKPKPVKVESGLKPALQVENDSHDFGKSGPAKRLNCEYSFKNAGTAPLVITKIQSTCGCTIPKIKGGKLLKDKSTVFEPGQSGKISLIFTTPNYEGPVTKHLYIISNDPKNPRYELKIKANIEFSVVTTPKSFNLSLKTDNAGIGPITIKSKDGKEFSILGFSSMRNAITAEFNRTKKATEFTIYPKVDLTKLQQAMRGSITININHPETSVIRIAYSAKPLFSINRPVIILQRQEPGVKTIKEALILSNYGDKVEIESIDYTKGYAKVIKQETVGDRGDRVMLVIEITPPAKRMVNSRTFLDKIHFKIKGMDAPLTCNISGYYTR